MKYFYFLLVGLLSLGVLYTLSGIGYIKWSYYQAENPKADFLIIDSQENNLTIVDFVSYHCGYCKQAHPVIDQALELHKDVRYIIRPVLLGTDPKAEAKQEPIELEKLAIAAGIQGNFKEIHDAFMDYPDAIIPEDAIKETAELYGIDYEQMVKDGKSKKVQKYLDDNMGDMLGIGIQSIPSYLIGRKIYTVDEESPDLKDFLTMITNEKK